MGFVDLHVHARLPLVGTMWRRHVQGFRLPGFDAAPAWSHGESRLHVLAAYESFLVRPRAARDRLFAFLEGLASAPPPGTALLRRAADLSGYQEGYLLAVESLRYLRDPGDLARLHALGVRSLQPVHFLDTPWGRSSLEGLLPPSRKGLSRLGREMLDEMGRLGLILDLAHMNDTTASESLSRYRGPVMCSHTGFRGRRDSARNLPAELAREIFRRGGAVGVTCWRALLGPRRSGHPPRGEWTRAFCEAAHDFAALAPGARVCVGSDRGAPIVVPAWFLSPGHLAEIDAALAERGWDAPARSGFRSGNALDFLRDSLPA